MSFFLLSIIGGMVPDRLREVLADADDGLVARMLFIWPEPPPIAPLCKSATSAERRKMLNEAAHRLHALKMGADLWPADAESFVARSRRFWFV